MNKHFFAVINKNFPHITVYASDTHSAAQKVADNYNKGFDSPTYVVGKFEYPMPS